MRTRISPLLVAAFALSLALAALLTGCGGQTASTDGTTSPDSGTGTTATEPVAPDAGGSDGVTSELAWLQTELVDVQTGRTFRISDFKGKPVLVKSFAVW